MLHYTAKPVHDTSEALSWKALPPTTYSPDLALFDYNLFALAEQSFGSYEDVKKWLDEWLAAKEEDFHWRGIYKFPARWKKYITSNGAHFE